jgi:hypothetical protein
VVIQIKIKNNAEIEFRFMGTTLKTKFVLIGMSRARRSFGAFVYA